VVNLVGDEVERYLCACGVKPHTTDADLRMVDGTRCSIEVKYNVPSSIGDKSHLLSAYFVPGLTTDVVLGMRCIEDLNLITVNVDPIASANPQFLVCATEAIKILTADEEERLKEFLAQELPLFDAVAGQTTLVEHVIRLKDNAVPIKQRHYPRNPAMQAIINEEVATMLRDGVIEPSDSPWSSPVVLIKKPSGKFRFCIDMRKVNDSSIKDAYPLPRINAILEKLRQAKYISTLDLKQGYWQVPLAKDSRPITAFTVRNLGLFQFRVMPFGLHSAGATFQRLLDRVIGPELEPKAFAYLDDLVIVSSSFEEHLELLGVVFRRLREAGLRLNPEKCHFARRELKYLGHVVNSDGISTDPEKVRAIKEFPAPTNVKALRSFLGLASWYRRFVEKFASISAPLRSLLKKNAKWLWGPEQAQAFEQLKHSLSTAPVLACPDFDQTFYLEVDASNEGLGAALTQYQNDRQVVVAYASRLLSDAERNYSTTEKEGLALVWAVRKFKPYLEGYHFVAITDHVALKWLLKLHEPTGRLARWVMDLQQFDFEVRYRKGTLNRVADALSRQPVPDIPSPSAQTVGIATFEVGVLTRRAAREQRRKDDETVVRESAESQEGSQVVEADRDDKPLQTPSLWFDRMRQLVEKRPNRYPRYKISGITLYRAFQRKNEPTTWRVCVPQEKIAKVLHETHDAATAGHLGVKKTLARVGAEYFWPNWRRDVKAYVRSCAKCQAYKVSQTKPAGKMYFRRPQGPWYVVSADLVGPLPRSQRGQRFLLVVQDTFSKWTELVSLPSATAHNVVTRLKSILLRHGAPDVLITDNGTQFVSKVVRELAAEWGVTLQTTAPYSPQSNPVERQNRVVKTMIAQFVKDNHKTWDNHLCEFQYALNSAVHDSTGFSPAMLCFGRELKPPRALRGSSVEVTDSPDDLPLTEVTRKRELEFKRLIDKARDNLKSAYQRQSHYYNLRRREIVYRPGDQVMRRLHVLSSAADAIVGKLAPKFHGPCTVVGSKGCNLYEVKDCDSNQTHTVHVKDMKPFCSRT